MLSTYQYSVIRFVPSIARDEAANVGVIVVDDESGTASGAFLRSIRSKVSALAPGFNVDLIADSVERLQRRAAAVYQGSLHYPEDARIKNSAQLRTLAGAMKNQIQLSEPRPYRAASLDAAAEQLYRDLVQPVSAPPAEEPPAQGGMSLKRLRSLIWGTIREWGKRPRQQETDSEPPGPGMVQIVRRRLGRGPAAQHVADFWLQMGEPVAALIAIPADPREHGEAWARRDAVPTIAADFRQRNPRFQAVAVLPPNGRQATPFEQETRALLHGKDGVIVAHADELADLRERIIPSLT
jgi:hypothetical protein